MHEDVFLFFLTIWISVWSVILSFLGDVFYNEAEVGE